MKKNLIGIILAGVVGLTVTANASQNALSHKSFTKQQETGISHKPFPKQKELETEKPDETKQPETEFEKKAKAEQLIAELQLETETEPLEIGTEAAEEEPAETETDLMIAEETEKDRVAAAIKTMTLEEKIAQMFFITPEALTGVDVVTEAGEMTCEAYDRYPVGGLIYFEQNIVGAEQWQMLSSNMLRYSFDRTGFPVLIGTDEEGGIVTRFSGRIISETIPYIPDMYSIGSSGNPAKAFEIGFIIGSYLKEFNVNLDFAPVADVYSNPENTVIGNRSFSSDPEMAALMVENEVKGLHAAGIMCTLKHFPGHGNTTGDSHSGKVYNWSTYDELKQCELLPFYSGIQAGADFIMIGHISLPNITGNDIPATFSDLIITELLRNDLGYEGVIITDAMNMGAVTEGYTSAEAALASIKAGADMILMPSDFQDAYHGVLEAALNGELPESQIDASVKRILKAKCRVIENMNNETGNEQADSE